jgi:hypothetical protein
MSLLFLRCCKTCLYLHLHLLLQFVVLYLYLGTRWRSNQLVIPCNNSPSQRKYGEVSIAPFLLNRRKVAATIVDLRPGEQARAFLEKVRLSPSNRTSVLFAISDSDAETAIGFKGGSNFVLRRPLTDSSIDHYFKSRA